MIYSSYPILLVFFAVIPVLHIMTCTAKKARLLFTAVSLLVHIAAAVCYVFCGAKMEEVLILYLFSVLFSMIAGEIVRRRKTAGQKNEKEDEA